MLESLFNKVTGLKACIFFKKDTPTQVFSYEYCKIFKNSFSMNTCSLYFSKILCGDRYVIFELLYFAIVKLGHAAEKLQN